MTGPNTSAVNVNGFSCRVWSKGHGAPIGFIAGYGGLPRWIPFLDRMAEKRRVIVPSLPGFPGGGRAHTVLVSHLDWLMAVRQLLEQCGLVNADLVGSSVGGALAGDVAAVWPGMVKRLTLMAPFGLFDETDPPADIWAQAPADVAGLLCTDPANYLNLKILPEGEDAVEWTVEQARANEAAARYLWPLGDTRLNRRLRFITASTLLLWGENDRIMPRSYAQKFMKEIGSRTELKIIEGAGHLSELDRPLQTADAILEWMSED